MPNTRLLIFICSRSPRKEQERLAPRVARYLEAAGIGVIAKLQMLDEQLALAPEHRRKMIFLNDCNSGCVKLLTKGLRPGEFVYVDLSEMKDITDFNVDAFFANILGPLLRAIGVETIVPNLKQSN